MSEGLQSLELLASCAKATPKGRRRTTITATVPTNSDSNRSPYQSHPPHLSHRVIVGNNQGVIIKTYVTVAIEVTGSIPVTGTGD